MRLTARSVSAEASASARQLCVALDEALSSLPFDAPTVDVNLILYHPMGMSEPIKPTGRFDAKRDIYWVTTTVPYVAWCRGDWTDRIALVSAATCERLARLPKSRFSADQKLAVISAFEAAAARTASRPPTSLVPVAPAYRTPGGGIAFDPSTRAPGEGRLITLAEIEAFQAAPPAPKAAETMFKTYRKVEAGLEYWEAWISDHGVTQHRGMCGHTGKSRLLPVLISPLQALESDRADAFRQGFRPIPETRLHLLAVELKADDGGDWRELLDRRVALEDWLNQELGWTGLGHCDGGEMGGGAATAYCLVVRVPLAVTVLKARLPSSPFADAVVRRG